MFMKNITQFLVAGVSVGSFVSLQAANPNIVFILADDLGYGDLGCYGNEVVKTPVIDKLSAEGVRFTNFYAGASVSSPSRCCLMTGLHTGHSRIRGNMCRTGGITGSREGMGIVRRTNLQPEDITIGNVLKDNGYYTCLVNKWHLDGFDESAGPLDRGFDEFYGWLINEPRSHNFYPDVRWRNRERYEIPANKDGQHGDHNTDRSTDEAIDFIKRMASGATLQGCKDATGKLMPKPFFLYLAYNAPHVPLDAKDRKLYENSGLPVTDQSYASLISHMDENIGKVLDVIKETGLDDNTIIIFASDNGGAKAANVEKLKLNGELRGWKGELYEGGIRVPVIVKWPGVTKPGSISDYPAYFPDFFATFSEISGSKKIKGDGESLVKVLKGRKANKNRMLYWEQYPSKGISQAVRYGKWKGIRLNNNQPWMLYNLETDKSETTNIAGKHPEIIRKIETFANSSHTQSECWPVDL